MSYEHGKSHYANGTAAGSKGSSDTGKDAATAVTGDLSRRHGQMMAAWAPYGKAGAIPEAISDDTGIELLCVRPRAGELVRRGLLFTNGKSMGRMGKKVTRYSVVKPEGPQDVV